MGEAEEEIYETGTKLFSTWGLDTPTAKAISILLFSPEPVSLGEIADKTGYSLATILNKIKLFEAIGVVQRIKRPGTKKVFYFMEKDRKKIIRAKMQKLFKQEMEFAQAHMPPLLKKYKGKKLSVKEKKMLAITQKFYTQSVELKKHLEEFLRNIENI